VKRALLIWFVLPGTALAHQPSTAYLTVTLDEVQLRAQGRLDVALRDLDHVLTLDEDGDGAVKWGELVRRQPAIAAYVRERLVVAATPVADLCPLTIRADELAVHGEEIHAVVRWTAQCAAVPQTLTYRLFFDADPQHRVLARLEQGGSTVLGSEKPTWSLTGERSPAPRRSFGTFLVEGMRHIAAGPDHLLFLLALLLPAVLRRAGRTWLADTRWRTVIWDVTKIVTAFTVAHSITLALATFDLVSLPSRWVEPAIAASVVLAAVNNVIPVVGRQRWVVAFALGLLHGLGFSGALRELGLASSGLAVALVGFNLGVEIGQLAFVAAILPVAFLLRRTRIYSRLVLEAGSLAIIVVASAWMMQRIVG
jgi:HupE/UreJ protein